MIARWIGMIMTIAGFLITTLGVFLIFTEARAADWRRVDSIDGRVFGVDFDTITADGGGIEANVYEDAGRFDPAKLRRFRFDCRTGWHVDLTAFVQARAAPLSGAGRMAALACAEGRRRRLIPSADRMP